MLKKQPWAWPSSLWLCCGLLLAITTIGRGEESFLGAIPVQFVAPGKELVLDMHRFFQAGGGLKDPPPRCRLQRLRYARIAEIQAGLETAPP